MVAANPVVEDCVQQLSKLTLDALAETSLGVKLDLQKGNKTDYMDNLTRFFELFTERFMNPIMLFSDLLYNLTRNGKESGKVSKELKLFTSNIIAQRKAEVLASRTAINKSDQRTSDDSLRLTSTRKRMSLLDLLLSYHLDDNLLSETDIQEQLDAFTFAGHDTTALSMTFICYLLTKNLDVQDRAFEEIIEVCGDNYDDDVTTNHVRQLKYLERVIKECLRHLSPSVLFARQLTEDIVTRDGHVIPAGADVFQLVSVLHFDAELFENPKKFDPDRFLPEIAAKRPAFGFIPFSAGNRNCLGQRFAMNEMRVVMANILRRFRVELVDAEYTMVTITEGLHKPRDKVRLRFVPRRS